MSTFTNSSEVKSALAHMSSSTSPGHDGNKLTLIKLACCTKWSSITQYPAPADGSPPPKATINWHEPTWLAKYFDILFDQFLENEDVSDHLKHAIISPIPKKGHVILNVDNIRPISVSPILWRIFFKCMASRLGQFLSDHSILNSAQSAFLPGGNIDDAIDAVLSTWEDASRRRSKTCKTPRNIHRHGNFTLFYDISRAYDSIRWSSIKLSMERLHLPGSFISLVMNSLKGSTACVRTAFGLSDTFSVTKAIKQGCPLAPLLFIMVMDPLHTRYPEFGAYTMISGHKVSSAGYADDTAIMADTHNQLISMNEWTQEFMTWHRLDINTSKGKSQAVGMMHATRSHLKSPIIYTSTDIYGISSSAPIDLLVPDQPIRYLGLSMTMTLDWNPAAKKVSQAMALITSRIRNNTIPPEFAVRAISQILQPRIDIALRHGQFTQLFLTTWDRNLAGALSHSLSLNTRASSRTLALLTQTHSPSHMHIISSLMSTLVRLNSPERHSHSHYVTCWSEAREISAASSCFPPPHNDSIPHTSAYSPLLPPPPHPPTPHTNRPRPSPLNRLLTTAHYMRWAGLDISMNPHFSHYNPHNLPNPAADAPPNHLPACHFNGEPLHLPPSPLPHIWGQLTPPPHLPNTRIVMATDGSTKDDRPSSSALVIMDDDTFTNEASPDSLARHSSWSIPESNNFHAELSGLCAALTSVPVSWPVDIHIDNLASIKSVLNSTVNACMPIRRLLRLSGRPYILMASRAILARSHFAQHIDQALPHTQLLHVRSHTEAIDIPSQLNNFADILAKEETDRPLPFRTAWNIPLPLFELQFVLSLPNGQICHDDTRLAIRKAILDVEWSSWTNAHTSLTNGASLALIPCPTHPAQPRVQLDVNRTASLSQALRSHTAVTHRANQNGSIQALLTAVTGKLAGCTPEYSLYTDHHGPWDIHHPNPASTYLHRFNPLKQPPDPYEPSVKTCPLCDDISPLTPSHILICPFINPNYDNSLAVIAASIDLSPIDHHGQIPQITSPGILLAQEIADIVVPPPAPIPDQPLPLLPVPLNFLYTRVRLLCSLAADHALRNAPRPLATCIYVNAIRLTLERNRCTCSIHQKGLHMPIELSSRQVSCPWTTALHIPINTRRLLVHHFRLTSDALSSSATFDDHPQFSPRFWNSPHLSDRLLGASGQNWAELAGRYSLLTPCSPIPETHRVSSDIAIRKARLAAAETKLPTRIVLIVPSDNISRHAAKALLFGYPAAMILTEIPASPPFPSQVVHCSEIGNEPPLTPLQFPSFLVLLVQNPAARSRNPCSLPTIIAALRSNSLSPQPFPFPRPRTSFCAPLYSSLGVPLPSFHFLQWADLRDSPSLPDLAPSSLAPASMHAIAHPRSLGAIGIIPHKFNITLSTYGLSHSAKSISQVSSLLRANTISAIQKWLVREHSLFH
jgi:hypothetical protein